MEIRFFLTASGHSPVEKYLEGLEARERALIADGLFDLERNGFNNSAVVTQQIDRKLWEIKISQHRIFYVTTTGPILVLLHAYKKQGAKAPRREIEVALKRLREVLSG